jgi:probable rRNA maturation factor
MGRGGVVARDVTVLVGAADLQDVLDEELLKRSVEEALAAADDAGGGWQRGEPVEVSIRVTDDAEMRRLNLEYRGVDRPTDVLSFSFLPEGEEVDIGRVPGQARLLGEIILSYPYAQRQAVDLGHSVRKELAWLTIHGSLQLLGYRHDTEEEATRMEAIEQAALSALGLSDE